MFPKPVQEVDSFTMKIYLRNVVIRDMINFKGDNEFAFADGCASQKRGQRIPIPNDLSAFIGENNTGKSSLLRLIEASTDVAFLEDNWEDLTLFNKVNVIGESSGAVACEMDCLVTHGASAEHHETHILGFFKSNKNGHTEVVGFWHDGNKATYKLLTKDNMHMMSRELDLTTRNARPEQEGQPEPESVESTLQKKLTMICSDIKQHREKFEQADPVDDNSNPWLIHARRLPKFICNPDPKVQVKEYWKNNQDDNTAQVKKVAKSILRVAGYEYYEIITPCSSPESEMPPSASSSSSDLRVQNTEAETDFNIDHMPEGHQFLLNIALNIAISSSRDSNVPACFLVEEPTRCMHPTLAHQVAWIIKDYCASHELQFIMTTHSPDVVRALHVENIYRCNRVSDHQTEVRSLYRPKSVPSSDVKEPKEVFKERSRDAMSRKDLVEKRMEEMLFAKMVMLVEGESDRRVMDALLKHIMWGCEQEHFQRLLKEIFVMQPPKKIRMMLRDLVVISVDGKGNIPTTIPKLQYLGIRHFSLVDADFFLGDARHNFGSKYFYPNASNEDLEELIERMLSTGVKGVEEKRNCMQHDSVAMYKLLCTCRQPCEITREEFEILMYKKRDNKLLGLSKQDINKISALLEKLPHLDDPELINQTKKESLYLLQTKFRALEGNLENLTGDTDRLKKLAECRRLIYLYKVIAAASVKEKMSLLEEFLDASVSPEKPLPGQALELFQSYLRVCQDLLRYFAYREGPKDFDLESFVRNSTGGKKGAEKKMLSECTDAYMKDLTGDIFSDKGHQSEDYKELLKFLFGQVLEYYESDHKPIRHPPRVTLTVSDIGVKLSVIDTGPATGPLGTLFGSEN